MPFKETHPLVASPAELQGKTNPVPSEEGRCHPTGVLSPFTQSAIAAISEALFSEDSGPMPKARLDWLVAEYSDFLSRAPSSKRLLFAIASGVVSFIAPLLIAKFSSFASLSFSDRVRALRRLETRPVGKILIPLRAILCLIYYEHPDAARDLGIHTTPTRLVQLGKQ
jgi:hypothetical protein